MVEVSLTVGRLDASLALLLTKDHHLIEFPTLLLPPDVEAGSVIRISCDRDVTQERKEEEKFQSVQKEILSTFGGRRPSPPQLRVRNVTQTSVVLEWDPIDVATAEVRSLSLYKNGQKFGVIPSPLRRKSTKLSGLAIDTEYRFRLALSTSAGDFESNEVTVQTHKMTDLSGVTICVGTLDGGDEDRAALQETVQRIGAKPLQDTVRLDTTHFVCTVAEGAQWQRAQDLNIPVVSPDWVRACEAERRLVGVRAYYLNADPKLRPPPTQRPRAESQGTSASSSSRWADRSREHVPEIKVSAAADAASDTSRQAVYERSREASEATERPSTEGQGQSEAAPEIREPAPEPSSQANIDNQTTPQTGTETEQAEQTEPAEQEAESTAQEQQPQQQPDEPQVEVREVESETEKPQDEPVHQPEPAVDEVIKAGDGPSLVEGVEPAPESAQEPSVESEPSHVESATEPAAEPATEPAPEPSTEPATEPAPEPSTKPSQDPAVDAVLTSEDKPSLVEGMEPEPTAPEQNDDDAEDDEEADIAAEKPDQPAKSKNKKKKKKSKSKAANKPDELENVQL